MLRDPRREGRRRCCPRRVGFGLGEPDLSSVQLVKDLTWSDSSRRLPCNLSPVCLLLSIVKEGRVTGVQSRARCQAVQEASPSRGGTAGTRSVN